MIYVLLVSVMMLQCSDEYLVDLLFDVIPYMGGTASSLVVPETDSNDIIKIQERLGKKYAIPSMFR